jgi:putative FmdB family regulatory protein
MPLFDYYCLDCGRVSELLISGLSDQPRCKHCTSSNLKKLMSAHSSLSGTEKLRWPGPGDTACCGSQADQAGCEGPGSCCGKSR